MPLSLNHPVGTENVDTGMGLNTVPCDGSWAPDPGFVLDFVYGAVYQGGSPPEMSNAQGGNVTNVSTGAFEFPSGLDGAACDSGGNADNNVKIWCVFRNTTTTEEKTLSEIKTFKGQC